MDAYEFVEVHSSISAAFVSTQDETGCRSRSFASSAQACPPIVALPDASGLAAQNIRDGNRSTSNNRK
jgi:hypothetical protein